MTRDEHSARPSEPEPVATDPRAGDTPPGRTPAPGHDRSTAQRHERSTDRRHERSTDRRHDRSTVRHPGRQQTRQRQSTGHHGDTVADQALADQPFSDQVAESAAPAQAGDASTTTTRAHIAERRTAHLAGIPLWLVVGALVAAAWCARLAVVGAMKSPYRFDTVFGDFIEMHDNSLRSWTSAAFWMPNRPLLWALSWRFAGRNAHTAVYLQLVVHVAAWAWFGYALGLNCRSRAARVFSWIVGLVFMTEPVVSYWQARLLTEPLSLSLAAATLSSWLHLAARPSRFRQALAIVCPLAFALQRDSNAVVMVVAGAACAGMWLWLTLLPSRASLDAARWRGFLATAVVVWACGSLYVYSSQIYAGRWDWAVIDQVRARSEMDPTNFSAYEDLGMKLDAAFLSARGGNPWVPDWMVRPELDPFVAWVQHNGQDVAATMQRKLWREDLASTREVIANRSTSPQSEWGYIPAEQSRLPLLGRIVFPATPAALRLLKNLTILGVVVTGVWRRRTRLSLVIATAYAGALASLYVSWVGEFWFDGDRHMLSAFVFHRAVYAALAVLVIDQLILARPWRLVAKLIAIRDPGPVWARFRSAAVSSAHAGSEWTYPLPAYRHRVAPRALTAILTVALTASLGLTVAVKSARSAPAESPRAFDRLAGPPGDRIDITVSPDRRWIAWVSDAGERSEVFIQSTDPSAPAAIQVTTNDVIEGRPTFSSDARTLAFAAGDLTGWTGLFVLDVSGWQTTSGAATDAIARQITHPAFAIWAPTFTPSGDKILAFSYRLHRPVLVDVARASGAAPNDWFILEDSYLATLGITPLSSGDGFGDATYSTFLDDGTVLASALISWNTEVVRWDPATGDLVQRLTSDTERWPDPQFAPGHGGFSSLRRDRSPYADVGPTLAPDGRTVVYCARAGLRGDFDILATDVYDGGVVNLTNSPGNQCWPAVSPDGRSVYFVGEVGDSRDIYQVPLRRPAPTTDPVPTDDPVPTAKRGPTAK